MTVPEASAKETDDIAKVDHFGVRMPSLLEQLDILGSRRAVVSAAEIDDSC